MPWDTLFVNGLSLLTILSQVVMVGFLFDLMIGKKIFPGLWNALGKHALFWTLIISLVAMLGSLTFSEVLGYSPCILCWYQRIAMYPIVLLSSIALWRKETRILPYISIMSIIGAFIAGFHYLGQINVNTSLPCDAVGYSSKCATMFVLQYGYVTIPMMAFTAFLLIIILFLMHKTKN